MTDAMTILLEGLTLMSTHHVSVREEIPRDETPDAHVLKRIEIEKMKIWAVEIPCNSFMTASSLYIELPSTRRRW